jgi:hypothetical protein
VLISDEAAERFALPACGRAWILFGSRKNSKPEKCLKMLQNPTRQVHALLARFCVVTYPFFIHVTIMLFIFSCKNLVNCFFGNIAHRSLSIVIHQRFIRLRNFFKFRQNPFIPKISQCDNSNISDIRTLVI